LVVWREVFWGHRETTQQTSLSKGCLLRIVHGSRDALLVMIVLASGGGASGPARGADFVIHISVDGLRPDYLQTLVDGGQAPNFKRFQTEGAWTNNARTDYTHTNTLPNHTSMLTGRPVSLPSGMPAMTQHGFTLYVDPDESTTLHNFTDPDWYKASAFDVVHDAGMSTALYASKNKFVIYEQSYDATHGAAHANGRDKIDAFANPEVTATMQNQLLAGLAANHFSYTFVHYADADDAGHGVGWGTPAWNTAVTTIDGYLGQLFEAIEEDSVLAGKTAIVLSADHGGNGTSHSTATLATSYTIPFYAWGAGVAHGDFYALNAGVRTSPGTGRPDYNAAGQPIRNGDGGNPALALLGLPAIPGSLINKTQTLRVATPGDFDGDGVVDGADLATWRANAGAVAGASAAEGDANGDHDVDGADFLVWQRQWNGGQALQSVPEPAGAALAAAAIVAVSMARDRRRVLPRGACPRGRRGRGHGTRRTTAAA
jgi:hypothetical protein